MQIKEYLRNSKDGTLFIFVPYIRTAMLEKLLERIQSRTIIITTWEPSDLLSGSSDISLYPFCRDRGIPLYTSRNLHLKVYSMNLKSAILVTGNISRRGLLPDGNHEAGILIEELSNADRLFFERIRMDARLVDDKMYEELKEWIEENQIELPKQVSLDDVISAPGRDDFLISALPMTKSVDELVLGYKRICLGKEPLGDSETAACVFHDLANYGIELGLSEQEFKQELSYKFFAHPFIQRIDSFITPGAYFGSIKEWVQNNCTDVPVPSRRELTGNVQVLLEWFVVLGSGQYVVDVPGARSQRIRKT